MRLAIPAQLEEGRVRDGPYASTAAYGTVGAFFVVGPKGARLKIMSSGPDEEYKWEHVSVSCENRTPNWAEMNFVKDLFWHDDEVVMQLHPAKTEYVNCHPHTLHLWRPMIAKIPTPPSILVGPKT